MSSETSKPYKCQECGETFNSQSELQEHNNVSILERHNLTAESSTFQLSINIFTHFNFVLRVIVDEKDLLKQ